MIINLTNSEACNLIRQYYNLSDDSKVQIVPDYQPPVFKVSPVPQFDNINNLVNYIDGQLIDNNKILAIKALRSYRDFPKSYGLKEAKDMVEDWKACREFMIRYCEIPTLQYNQARTMIVRYY